MSSNLRLGLPKGLFPVGLPVQIFKDHNNLNNEQDPEANIWTQEGRKWGVDMAS